MAPFDPAAVLPDISAEQPTGENLEFDPAFAELDRLAQGKPEQQYGSTVVPAEEPDWREVIAGAEALTERTYDLRVLAHLAVARLHREGLPAYAGVLNSVRQLLIGRWADVHPQLDPEDDNDPTLRANGLLRLADPVRVVRFLRSMPLARSARAGSVSWRDIAIANGTLEAPEDAPRLSEATIAGVFRESDPEILAALRAAVDSAHASILAIPAAFDDAAGHGSGPDFTELARLLRDLRSMIDGHAQAAASAEPPDASGAEAVGPEADGAAVVPTAAAPARAQPAAFSIQTMGPPTSRADAMRLLDLVIEFYERNEPSSPLPLLIARARRLADKGFMDILRDLAPDGISQAERIAGTENSGSDY